MEEIIKYNIDSAQKYDWSPSWFGCSDFDSKLIAAVKEWQGEHSLVEDGYVGPMTYRRVWTDRQANISKYKPSLSPFDVKPSWKNMWKKAPSCEAQKHIVHNGNFISIDWGRVVLWDEKGGLSAKKGNYYDYSGKEDRKPINFVNHWDVCLSSESCQKVLNKRGISVHFLIDNDGTIYQTMDTQHGAWHAGDRKANHNSIGVEISNAYYPKYQSWYVENGFDERPVLDDSQVHGRTLPPHLGFYPVQINALKALWKAVHEGIGIPLRTPMKGSTGATVRSSKITNGNFPGFVCHYHYTRNKIDCAGLDLVGLLNEVKDSIED
jgi:hypothetical protein